MKLKNIIMALDQHTQMEIVVRIYGMNFSTKCYAERFLNSSEYDELLDKSVGDLSVTDEKLLRIELI